MYTGVADRLSIDRFPRVCHSVRGMGTWLFNTWNSGSALRRHFAILSFVAIALITAALSFTVTSSLRDDMLEREWANTADYIRTSTRRHLTLGDFTRPGADRARQHFEALYEQAVAMPEIIRVKLYDADMRVVWSDESRLIGQQFRDNPHLARALTGHTVVNLEGGERKPENRYEGNEFSRLVEVYVPVMFPASSRVVGVVETYKAPAQVFASIQKAQLIVVGASVAGGVLLYLSLFWIVGRASRRIDEQRQSLENHGRELARTNEELVMVQGQLLEAERLAAIGEVVTAVAHGIRNPLANIRAAAQVAGLAAHPAGARDATPRHLASIMAEVDRLEARLKELLQFVRPADRQGGPVDLNAVVREAANMVAGRLTTANIRLTQNLAPTLPPVSGNAMLLEQVILSLLANAIEAMPDGGGAVIVTTGDTSDGMRGRAAFVEVSDTGTGISEEMLPKLFAPFCTTKAQGTGLGLAMAKKFTEAHGGTISGTNRPDGGATFRVIFPVHQEA